MINKAPVPVGEPVINRHKNVKEWLLVNMATDRAIQFIIDNAGKFGVWIETNRYYSAYPSLGANGHECTLLVNTTLYPNIEEVRLYLLESFEAHMAG